MSSWADEMRTWLLSPSDIKLVVLRLAFLLTLLKLDTSESTRKLLELALLLFLDDALSMIEGDLW